jgi:hypothetical protein
MTYSEPIIAIARDTAGSPLTGVTDLYLTIQRPVDGMWFDFSDNTFKAAISVIQLRQVLIEVDSIRAPGQYKYIWNIPSTEDTYQITIEQTPGTSVKNVPISETFCGSFRQIPDMSTTATLIRKLLKNRLELAEGSTNNWVLYDDDNVSPLIRWNVSDKSGSSITIGAGVPAKRLPL